MIYNTRNRSMIQQKVRKKKRPFVMLIFSTVSRRTKQNVFIRKLSYVNVWQMNRESRLVCMQCNIRDSHALFWCFVLIILRMDSLDTLLLCSACLTLFLALFLIFFFQNQGFCSHKIALIKKEVYIHNGKRQRFSEFFSFRKSTRPTVWVERKRFYLVHQKTYLFGQATAYSETDQRTLWILR